MFQPLNHLDFEPDFLDFFELDDLFEPDFEPDGPDADVGVRTRQSTAPVISTLSSILITSPIANSLPKAVGRLPTNLNGTKVAQPPSPGFKREGPGPGYRYTPNAILSSSICQHISLR